VRRTMLYELYFVMAAAKQTYKSLCMYSLTAIDSDPKVSE